VYLGRLHSRPDRAGRGVGSLGAAIHLAMERLVQTVDAHQPPGTFGALVSGLWDGALAEVFGPMARPRSIPAYHLKLARLKNAANHLQELLSSADHFHPEMQLGTSDHVLRGRADLVGYSATGTWILDYKSGIERDPTTGAAQVEDHFRQLRLYAAMLRDMDGNWPARLILLPLDGPPILQPVDAAQCEAEDHEARELMSRYNATLPGTPEARPSPAACRFCDQVLNCQPFGAACDEEWGRDLLALSGVLIAVEVSARGGWSAVVDVVRGSVPRGRVAVTHVSETLHPPPPSTAIGARVDAVGLYETSTPAVYGLRDSGIVRIE
jgi:hypothetical protein